MGNQLIEVDYPRGWLERITRALSRCDAAFGGDRTCGRDADGKSG